MNSLTVVPLDHNDLINISRLKPTDWQDIVPFFKFYIDSPFCFPIKALLGKEIAGVGTAICFKETAWLAHIIVGEEFRNRGIGLSIVNSLVESVKEFPSILLIATKLGEPVYKKAGFETVTEYIFFKDGITKEHWFHKKEIIPYDEKYKNQLLSLDKKISGEQRGTLITEHFPSSQLYIKKDKLAGYFIPTLGDGLIIADNDEAGIELMKLKYSNPDIKKAVLPADNIAGVNFLLENNFIEALRANRMVLGKNINWHPEKLYSRIGGHVG